MNESITPIKKGDTVTVVRVTKNINRKIEVVEVVVTKVHYDDNREQFLYVRRKDNKCFGNGKYNIWVKGLDTRGRE